MHGHVCGRQPLGERDSPWEITRTSIVVTDHETPNPPDRVANGECGRRRSQRSEDGNPSAPQHPDAGSNTSEEAAKPAHAPTAEKKVCYRLLAQELKRPEQLRTC